MLTATLSTEPIHLVDEPEWTAHAAGELLDALESGQVLHFTGRAFELPDDEQSFLGGDYAEPKSKNISYHVRTRRVKGLPDDLAKRPGESDRLATLLDRYARSAQQLLSLIAPSYPDASEIGRTSFRPAQVRGRTPSIRKNDALLHVDSFPATPVQGKRILRVFANINPHGENRVWHVGEPLTRVVERFVPGIRPPVPGKARLLQLLHLTKTCRTPYDHYMLKLEDAMRADSAYQQQAVRARYEFQPDTMWMCFTDQVSHAALSGQYALEQTFYVPVSAMKHPEQSPLRRLEAIVGRPLL